jgi:hypothetical protein
MFKAQHFGGVIIIKCNKLNYSHHLFILVDVRSIIPNGAGAGGLLNLATPNALLLI